MLTLRYLANPGPRALPWVCLMIVSATAAHAMQVGVESNSATAGAVDARPAPVRFAANPAEHSVVVLISFVDAGGNREELACTTTDNRVSTDSQFLTLEVVHDVVANLCDSVYMYVDRTS